MAADVIPFPDPSPEQVLERMREIGLGNGNLWVSAQPRRQLAQRRTSWPQITEVLRLGYAASGPWQDLLGDWACQFVGRAVGRNVEMDVMMPRGGRRLVILAVRV